MTGSVSARPSRSGRLEVEVRVAGHVSVAGTKRLTTRLRPSEPYMILETEYEDTGIRASADYVLGLPARKSLGLTLEMLNGDFRVESLPCGLDVSIHNGSLSAEEFTGQLHARVINGSVDVGGSPTVSFVRAGGSVDLDIGAIATGGASVTSLGGSIQVRLAEGLGLQLAARSETGGVGISGLTPENVGTEYGGFRCDIEGGGHRLALNAVNGGIRLLPSGG